MTTRAEKDAEAVEQVKTMLMDPKIGINNPSRKAIMQLFEYVVLKKQVDPDVLQRWRQLGRLTNDNVIDMERKMFPLELSLMSLEWDGKIGWAPNIAPEVTPV